MVHRLNADAAALNSVPFAAVAMPGSMEESLLRQADGATRAPDGRTSTQELDAYLGRASHRDVLGLFEGPRLDALRARLDEASRAREASRASLPPADVVLRERTMSAEAAAALIQPGDRVMVPIGHMAPTSVLEALRARAQNPDELDPARPVRIFGGSHMIHPAMYATEGKIVPDSIFLDGSSREAYRHGLGSFIPVYLHRIPALVRSGRLPVDVALVRVSPPDADGYVSLGTSAAFGPAGLGAAREVIAEMNPHVPRTRGDTRVHISELDHIVRSERPLFAVPAPPMTEVDVRIAENILGLIPEGATLQFGIGGVPNAVAAALASQGRTGFKVHSEMISDGVMLLDKAGAIAGDIEFAFALGSEDMLAWMDGHPRLVAKCVEEINEPSKLKQIDKFVAINSALRIDLKGQANAQQINGTMYSGVGGQVDFMRGAMASRDGRAILALPATKTVTNAAGEPEVVSTIVPHLTKDDVVTTPMHDVQFVVTEFGVADLDGKSMVERAKALIAVADPSFRPDLERELMALMRRRSGG